MSQMTDTYTAHTLEVPDSHAEHAGHGAGDNSAISGAMFFWFLTIFVVAALILKKYAFGPILQALDQREAEIETSLENADHLKRELAQLDEKISRQLQESEDKVRAMIDSGREAAREAGKVIEEQAREEAQIIRENASREIASELGKAENALRAHSAETAVQLAMQLLQEKMDDQTRKALADKLIAGV